MRLFFFLLLQVFISAPLISFAAETAVPINQKNIKESKISETRKTDIKKAYGKLPLYFIENKGQVDKSVRFYERGAGHTTFFTDDGVVLALTKTLDTTGKKESSHNKTLNDTQNKKSATEVLRLSFMGTNKNSIIIASDPQQGRVNYFTGNDRSKWRTNIPTYRTLTYKNIYDNIDIKFYGSNRDLEHDIIVHPGGDILKAIFFYMGAEGLNINKDGDLEIILARGVLVEKKPFIYQNINGKRKTIEGSYRILSKEDNSFSYGYTVALYDHTKALVIDPVLTYSTYLGGSGPSAVNGIAIDLSGAAYITGRTISTDFPILTPIQGTFGGGPGDIFVTKINPAGSALLYSTYLGGSDYDGGNSIAVDATGATYITGRTASPDFPLAGAIQNIYGGDGVALRVIGDSFITKLSPSGSALIYSTYLGGSGVDIGNAIAIDSTGAASVTGQTDSTDFPVANPLLPTLGLGGSTDAFVTKINPAGSALIYSTYLGGNDYDGGYGIAVDGLGAAYVVGSTSSTDFPIANPIQGAKAGVISTDLFITKINSTGSALVYSTYLGGTVAEFGYGIAVDSSGAAYVTGSSSSLTDYPLVNPIQGHKSINDNIDIIVTKLNPAGSAIVYSTFLRGSSYDYSSAIAVDAAGAAYITGFTRSTDYPLLNPIQNSHAGFYDAIITKINPLGSAILYSTYLGGSSDDTAMDIAVDSSGAAYVGGFTLSPDFPLINPLQVIKGGNVESAFISKINPAPPPVLILVITQEIISPKIISVPQGSTLGYTVTATNTSATQQCFNYWENVTQSNGPTYPATGELFGPVHLCLDAGASQSTYLIHDVPLSTPPGRYALNAFIGAYGTAAKHILVHEAHFTFDVTAFSQVTRNPNYSWRLIKNGFIN